MRWEGGGGREGCKKTRRGQHNDEKKNKKIKEERGRGDASWQAGASRLQQQPPDLNSAATATSHPYRVLVRASAIRLISMLLKVPTRQLCFLFSASLFPFNIIIPSHLAFSSAGVLMRCEGVVGQI